MIIAKIERLRRLQSNFCKLVFRDLFICIICIFCSFYCFSQTKYQKLKPDAIGIYYGIGNEDNLLFDDPDYLYKTQYLKASFQYQLNAKKYRWGLAVQPQIHFLQHQLLNPFFVRNSEENFEEDRLIFTKLKSMQLYALEFEINVRRVIFKKLEISAFFGVGPAIIDTRTERLAKGFTFIENIGIGIHYKLSKNIFLELRPTLNHVSNARIQLPNSGYNVLNLEVGVSWNL